MVQEKTTDDELVRQIHSSAENKFSETRDFIYLAESILKRFSDNAWARNVYAKAAKASDVDTYKFDLAASITNKLDDTKWAFQLRR